MEMPCEAARKTLLYLVRVRVRARARVRVRVTVTVRARVRVRVRVRARARVRVRVGVRVRVRVRVGLVVREDDGGEERDRGDHGRDALRRLPEEYAQHEAAVPGEG